MSVKVLRDVVKPWMDAITDKKPYIFQQISAPAHEARVTHGLRWMFPTAWSPDFWSPSFPELNLKEYYVWDVVERETNKYPHNTLDWKKKKKSPGSQGLLLAVPPQESWMPPMADLLKFLIFIFT